MKTGRNLDSRWATFSLGSEMFALPVEGVQEVLMGQDLTPVPLAPAHIIGLLNLRGQIIPAIALRRRLRFPEHGDKDHQKILVLKCNDGLISVVVDDIGDVLDLPPERWREPPATLLSQHRKFIEAICPIDGFVVSGLNIEALLRDEQEDDLGGEIQ